MRASSRPTLGSAQLKIKNIPTPIIRARKPTRRRSPGKMRPAFGWRGGYLSSSPNFGSSPSGIVTAVSVAKLTQIICTASSGALPIKVTARISASSSPRLVLSKKKITLRRRLKIALPSSTAATIEAKLSSASTMSQASLATSVPVMPIAMPILAVFRAGASLTPSPVMATTCPRLLSAFTILSFCSGSIRAKTKVSSTCLDNSSSLISLSSALVIALPGGKPSW